VSGDHGQTLGGDHGGGSPEEVDSALVAVDLGALHASMHSTRSGDGSSNAAATSDNGSEGGSPAAPASALLSPAACRANCTCGVEGNQCVPDLAQMDLTPTLAAMLDVPIPFGNLGKLSPELWQLTHSKAAAASMAAGSGDSASSSSGESAAPADAGAASAVAVAAWERSLGGALLANARQVHSYLNTYAATASATFSRPALARLNALFDALPGTDAGSAALLAR